MFLLSLVLKSLKNRKLTTLLTIFSIALSVMLLVGVENIRRAARDSFSGTVSQTDLIVGAPSGAVQLMLYTIFHIGAPTANVSYEAYQKYSNHPRVDWTIPISLGDSHRGFRVVATDDDFYEHFRFRGDRRVEFAQGYAPRSVFDVVLGSEVAEKLHYDLNAEVIIAHGMSNFVQHKERPFKVSGILERTGTPIDRSLYISLYGMEAIHVDWDRGAPPLPGQATPADQLTRDRLQIHQITAFLLKGKSRMMTLGLQREINTDESESLMAIIPGVTLAEMWQGIGYAEQALQLISIIVVLVGLAGMLMTVYSSLNERRREMAILRAVGAHPYQILLLMILESGLLSIAGCALGLTILYAGIFITQPLIEDYSGLYIAIRWPGWVEGAYLFGVILAGFLLGLVPALRAYRNTLSDGLTIRV
ncbi:MAG: ABC transporter permease [Leptospiraceae bacterium]|nr:ABC transporter permease [Leptospiraceae bacterium]